MAIHSQPDFENKGHRSINESWTCMYGKCEWMSSLSSITGILAAIIDNTASDAVTATF
jgi:hypothetical protein